MFGWNVARCNYRLLIKKLISFKYKGIGAFQEHRGYFIERGENFIGAIRRWILRNRSAVNVNNFGARRPETFSGADIRSPRCEMNDVNIALPALCLSGGCPCLLDFRAAWPIEKSSDTGLRYYRIHVISRHKHRTRGSTINGRSNAATFVQCPLINSAARSNRKLHDRGATCEWRFYGANDVRRGHDEINDWRAPRWQTASKNVLDNF